MKQKKSTQRNWPLVVVVAISLLIGLFIFKDYGASWDEPEYYEYADSTLHAYSIRALVDGQYSIESSFGPADLRYYGPSFLLLGKAAQSVLSIFFPKALDIELWHLWIYLFFLIGSVFFYFLARRMTTERTAIVATVLFISQPVLFGNAWINPKDIPLLVYFLGTIYFGLLFLDLVVSFLSVKPDKPKATSSAHSKEQNPRLLVVMGVLLLCVFTFAAGGGAIKAVVSELILNVNISAPATLFDRLFVASVQGAGSVPLSYYSEKSVILYDRFLLTAGVLAGLLSLLLGLSYFQPGRLAHLWNRFKQDADYYAKAFQASPSKARLVASFLAACFFLASASATRVIGPLAGFLVLFVWVVTLKKRSFPLILLYGFVSFAFFYIQWPYIWQDTLDKLIFVIRHMSNNPVGVNALFAGTIYDSRDLPAAYFPKLLSVTLTEPALILILLGLFVLVASVSARQQLRLESLLVLGWLFVPIAYIVLRRPPMYDNYRHFLFLLPGFFLLAAKAIEFIFARVRLRWGQTLFAVLLVLPGFVGILQTHPFQYSYYNSLVGGTTGANGNYELDYWMTCYKHLADEVQENEPGPVNVYVDLTPDVVSIYQHSKLTVFSINDDPFPAGSLLFLPSRWDHSTLFSQYPVAYAVALQGVDLCIARRVQ